jgi:site-specific DNA recombinase
MDTPQLKYCLYARKSSEQDERQAMSIDSQIKEMTAMAVREGLTVAEIKQESHSAKQSGQRPVFLELIADLRSDKFQGILTWAPDRLSRNAGDLGSLVDLMDSNHLVHIRTFGQSFSNTPNEKFLLMILCSQAKLENDNRGVNVKRGIRAKCEMGWRPCMPPLGYYTRGATGGAKDVIIDTERAPYITKMFEMSADGKSGRHIKQWLIDNDAKTRTGKTIPLSMIYKILKSTFYYGEFEYPKNSGNWYVGKHEPLITKEIFNRVQEQLKVPEKSKWGAKEFPFKQFLKCASCGSSIVGEEKFKQRKDGGRNRHVYYHCSRQVDYQCQEPYVKESSIINGLIELSDSLKFLDTMEPGLQKSMNQFATMMRSLEPTASSQDAKKGYVKYLLTQGTDFEKTRLIRNLNTKLVIKNKELIEIT